MSHNDFAAYLSHYRLNFYYKELCQRFCDLDFLYRSWKEKADLELEKSNKEFPDLHRRAEKILNSSEARTILAEFDDGEIE